MPSTKAIAVKLQAHRCQWSGFSQPPFDQTFSGTQIAAAVPEPATWAIMILGFACVGFMAHHRKSKPGLVAA
jgi:hypothetical protein